MEMAAAFGCPQVRLSELGSNDIAAHGLLRITINLACKWLSIFNNIGSIHFFFFIPNLKFNAVLR
jgi:hypothetical protein